MEINPTDLANLGTAGVEVIAAVKAGGFLKTIIGPSADEVGAAIMDSVREWRFRRQVNILIKADEYIKAKGLKTKKVALKNLVPLLEHSSLEEEEGLKEKWDAMLINYVDSEKNFTTNVYPNILSQMSLEEYRILEYISELGTNFTTEHLLNQFPMTKNIVSIRQNLIRLGLIESIFDVLIPPSRKGSYLYPAEYHVRTNFFSPATSATIRMRYKLTVFGREFLDCCSLNIEAQSEKREPDNPNKY